MNSASSILISIAYMPPISYIRECIRADKLIIESREHFIKQTYRNRCHIYGANGLQTLIIPVKHDQLFSKPISEVEIITDQPWNKIHWKAITSAYRKSAFFEFYEEDLSRLFHVPEISLLNFNLKCLEAIFKLIQCQHQLKLTEHYEKEAALHEDLRNVFHPKRNPSVEFPRYHQVFEDRHGFLPNLSILDLLCNMGPSSRDYLLKQS